MDLVVGAAHPREPVKLVTTHFEEDLRVITLTDAAAVKVKDLIDAEGDAELALRVAVRPGGARASATRCSSTATSPATTSRPTSTA